MITIDQLLESVDLDFEPRFVTKDEDGNVWIWNIRPDKNANWCLKKGTSKPFRGRFISECLKLAEFENKHWTECIYEVPRKTTGKIEKLEPELMEYTFDEKEYETLKMPSLENFMDKINEIIDWINDNYKDFK